MASEVTDAPSSTTILTEDELLGHSTHITIDHDVDEEALLGGEADDAVAQDEKAPVEESIADTTFEREELDYDDDEEQEERPERSKFTSERAKAPMTSISTSSTATASVSNTSTSSSGYSSGRGNYNNNNFKRRGGMQNRPKLPSLLGMQVRPPPGGKILVNPNFIPNQPLVRLNMPGSQPITMCPPMSSMPSAFITGPAGPIVPRLPNGIPLVALPPNHGVAGFGGPPPPMPMPPPMMMGNPGNWDQAVNAFLNPTQKRTRRRSSSYSSYSSNGSSRSRSPRRRRGGNGGRREEKRRRRSGDRSHRREERRRDSRRDYGGHNNDRSERRRGERTAEECAKAVGVDNEYLDRIEEQKRRRDELIKKKEQRRCGANDEPEPSKKFDGKEGKGEKKAHLCVVIRNMKHLPTAQQKIEKLAAEVGPITKCWRYNDDIVHLIFADHANAKAFLVKFNGKVLSGLRMQVHVEKAYLNLAEIK